MDWIHPTQDKDQWRAVSEHSNAPLGSIHTVIFLTS